MTIGEANLCSCCDAIGNTKRNLRFKKQRESICSSCLSQLRKNLIASYMEKKDLWQRGCCGAKHLA